MWMGYRPVQWQIHQKFNLFSRSQAGQRNDLPIGVGGLWKA
jgi:hypothetical protein